MKTYLQHLRSTLLTGALLLLSASGLFAQPTGYCTPDQWYASYPWGGSCSPKDAEQWGDIYAGGMIKQVKISNGDGVALERNSGDEWEGNQCYIFTGVTGEVMLGETYDLTVHVRLTGYEYSWGYSYCPNSMWDYYTLRIFIDWNMDGDFEDPGEWYNDPTGPNIEPPWRMPCNIYPGCAEYDLTYSLKIPDNVQLGKTVMRVMSSYYYPYSPYYPPENPCHNGYWDVWNATPMYGYDYGETEDYILEFALAIKNTFPDNKEPNDLLYAGEKYNGETRQRTEGDLVFDYKYTKPFVEFGGAQQAGTKLTYKIVGPLPSADVLYEALDPDNGSNQIEVGNKGTMIEMKKSTGPCSVDGDGSFMFNNGGEYQLVASVALPGKPAKQILKNFTVSWPNDVAAMGVVSPKTNGTPNFFKYPNGLNIQIQGEFMNVGLNNVTKFDATAKIFDSKGNVVYNELIPFDTSNHYYQLLRPKAKTVFDFPVFKPNYSDIYRLVLYADLKNAKDYEPYNNRFSRELPDYTFEVADEIQAASDALNYPKQGDELVAGRPIIALGDLLNKGVGDISDAKAKFRYRLLPNGKEQSVDVTVKDIPSGRYNRKSVKFPPVIITEPGNYEGFLEVIATGDNVPADNTIRITFTVISGLQGTYTVGQKYLSSPNNFPTIDSALKAIYFYGLRGSSVFELTDPVYNVYSTGFDTPAMDLSSTIIGLGYDKTTNKTNTLTWKPSTDRATTRGGVAINLHSANGKGVFFGQSANNANPYALTKSSYGADLFRQFCNSKGYITFDGGKQKSLKFNLITTAQHGAAFYLNRGSSNINISNCLIETASPQLKNNTWIPRTRYAPSDGFSYLLDSMETVDRTLALSAGIVNRATMAVVDSNRIKLDTVPNLDNAFRNNEIRGYGNGIVSLGIGPLMYAGIGDFKGYYNNNTEISGNKISNVGACGIYLGFEENAKVFENQIFNIDGTGSNDVAGIILGDAAAPEGFGYNNSGITVRSNEISALTGNGSVTGIKVQQTQTRYPKPSGGMTSFPKNTDAFSVYSNAVWGLSTTSVNAERYGIRVFSERVENEWTVPKRPDYFITNVLVANNTVIINDDQVSGKARQYGVALQNVTGARLFNNAIAMLDNSVQQSAPYVSAVYYEGTMPKPGIFESDYNVFYLAGNNASIYRFDETDQNSNIIQPGYDDEYKNLSQWQQWTSNDVNSVAGVNFTMDLLKYGDNPQMLRISNNPLPKGSVLENRGAKIAEVSKDLDGMTRGEAGRRYDIGASEFSGRMYVDDAEMLYIEKPGAYRPGESHPFNEAEYVMTAAPVEVQARIRNNGSLLKSQTKVTVRISCEQVDGSFQEVLNETASVPVLEASESADVAFGLADGMGKEFVPQSYGDLNRNNQQNKLPLYTIPANFASMSACVTPLYKIRIEPESDEFNSNNAIEKTVRFYVMHSPLKFLVSGNSDRSPLSVNPSISEDAVKLNADSLLGGLKKMGWYTDINKYKYDIDYFDRTSWNDRTVDYSIYRTIAWTDGHEEAFASRFVPISISNFLSSGTTKEKKNFIMASQEVARANTSGIGALLVNNDLRAYDKSPSNPLGIDGNYNGNKVTGVSIARNLQTTIKSTLAANDDYPKPGLFSINSNGEGLSQIAFIYNTLQPGKNGENGAEPYPNTERIMGVATSTMSRNIVLLGVDWRHFGNLDNALRGSFDFIENNGGTVVPVELLDFSAEANGKRVDLNWSTASELNSSKFEVERSQVSNAGISGFAKIDEMTAMGKTSDVKHYGPVVDKNVEWGNTYVYRLKMIDRDGTSSYSPERTVTLSAGTSGLSLRDLSPNPVRNSAVLGFNLGEGATLTADLYDMSGRKISTLANGFMPAGYNEIKIDAAALTSGVYTVIINAGGATVTTTMNVVK